VWQAAHAAYNAALAEGATSEAASSAAAIAAAAASGKAHDGSSSSSSLLEAEHQQTDAPQTSSSSSSSSERVAAAAAAATSAVSVGPSLVLEQAVGVVCMLVHNPDNHFAMVGEGLVPLLVSLLHKGRQKDSLAVHSCGLLFLLIQECNLPWLGRGWCRCWCHCCTKVSRAGCLSVLGCVVLVICELHFAMVGEGLVPLLVSLLHRRGNSLAVCLWPTQCLLCLLYGGRGMHFDSAHQTRLSQHAAVVCM
jgi:hypothetical protein